MKSKRLKRAALVAGLAGFAWSLVAIDPVVRSGRSADDLPIAGDNAPAESAGCPVKTLHSS